MFDLHDPAFDVAKESIVVPEEIDLLLQPGLIYTYISTNVGFRLHFMLIE